VDLRTVEADAGALGGLVHGGAAASWGERQEL
jgi:hypothetical protein